MGRVGNWKQHKLSRFKMREGGFMGQKHQNLDHSALDSPDFSRFLRLMILTAAVWSSWCEVNTGPRTTHAKLRGQWGWWSGFRICFGEESSSVLQHPYNYISYLPYYIHMISDIWQVVLLNFTNCTWGSQWIWRLFFWRGSPQKKPQTNPTIPRP